MASLVIQTIISEILKKPQITEADGYMLGACVVVVQGPWKLRIRDAIADVLESHTQDLCIKCGMEVGAGPDSCAVCGPITMLRKKLFEEEQDRLDVVIEESEEIESEEEVVEVRSFQGPQVSADDLIVCTQCGEKVPNTVGCISCGKDPRAPKVVVDWSKPPGTGYKVYEGVNLLDPSEDVVTYDESAVAEEEVLESSQQSERLEGVPVCYICQEKHPELEVQEDGSLKCPRCKSEWDNLEEYRQESAKEEKAFPDPVLEELEKQVNDAYPHHFKDGKPKKGKIEVHLRHINDMIELKTEDPFYGVAKLHLENHQGYEAPPAEPELEEEKQVPESLEDKIHEVYPHHFKDGRTKKGALKRLNADFNRMDQDESRGLTDLELETWKHVREHLQLDPVVKEEPHDLGQRAVSYMTGEEQQLPVWSGEDMRLLVVNKHLSPKALSFVLDKPVEEIEKHLEALQ